MTSITDIFTPLRELAHRDADGIDVTLLWDAHDDRALLFVVDSEHGTAFEVEVGDANPMHVFPPLRVLRSGPGGVIEMRRLRRLLCSHHQTVHASAGTHCASCGQRV